MAITRNYQEFKEKMLREGFDEFTIAHMPGSEEAYDLDRQADFEASKAKTIKDWLQVDKQGNPQVSFVSQEQITAAMKAPLYKSSPAYRAAVENCIGRMPAPPAPNIERGVGVDFSVEKLAENTRKEAARDAYRKLVVQAGRDPQARLQLIELLNNPDPAVQAWVSEGTSAIANEGPGQRMMREAGSGSFGPDLGRAMASEDDEGANNGNGSDPNNGPVGDR